MSRPTVFISYSHKDETWKDRLVTHLGVLAQQELLEVWDDRRIEGGVDWYPEIEQAMARASVALLMISADFLNSNFILRGEIPRLLERREKEGLRVMPVLLKPCAWNRVHWLSPIQLRPKDAQALSGMSEHESNVALAALAEEVWTILAPTVHEAVQSGFVSLPPEKISLGKMPATSPEVFGRERELEQLDAAWEDAQTNIVCLVAFGGVGKTALVNRWLLNMGRENFRRATRVLGWSFYSQGAAEEKQASAEPFVDFALRWFGDPDPTLGTAWEKGERLAELVRRQRTLLILDGLEPLQYPPGGKLRDEGLASLLKELASHNPGLCLITTRLAVEDLKTFTDATVSEIDLEELTPEAGAQLLAHLGVQGTTEELEQASREFDGHALALNLLGSYLAVAFQGDVRRRDQVPALMAEPRQGGQARRVMESYERWFAGQPELEILYLMGLFDRPAEAGALAVLKATPAIPGLTETIVNLSPADWSFAVHNLRQARLLAEADPEEPDTLDCHPLVREYFGERLKDNNPEAWQDAHGRLFDYFQKVAKVLPDTLEEMLPLYRAVAHGCQAGRREEALYRVYWRRISRGKEHYSLKKLGAFGADLAALASFFDAPWRRPAVVLTEVDQAFVLGQAGYSLRALGRLDEASEPIQTSLEAFIQQEDWYNAAGMAANLSELQLVRGSLTEAFEDARQALDLAERSGDGRRQVENTVTVSTVLHQMGRLTEAEAKFNQGEEMQTQVQPGSQYLYSHHGFLYCDLLLDLGRFAEVLERADQTLALAITENLLLDMALDHLSLGRAYLMQALAENHKDFTQATSHLNQAVQGLRQAGTQHHLPRGLLARAALYRITENFPQARKDLDEALALAERSGMRLHLADAHLEYARLHLAQGNRDQARDHLDKAMEIITETGYHRRDREVQELEAELEKGP